MTVQGLEDKDVFVCIHSPKIEHDEYFNGDLYLKFFTSDRNETGNVEWQDLSIQGGDSSGWKTPDINEIHGVSIAAGDFDGDGYKNEIAVCLRVKYHVYAYFYRLTIENGQAKVQRIYDTTIYNVGFADTIPNQHPIPNVVTGDFDGDGYDEAAFVNNILDTYYDDSNNCIVVSIVK